LVNKRCVHLDQRCSGSDLIKSITGRKNPSDADDRKILRDYFEVAVKPRAARELGLWKAYFAARALLGP
jgi:plasmid replication initiation protein